MRRHPVTLVVAIMALVPIATGLLAVLGGPAAEPGGELINASLDSEYRFAHVIWTAVGVGLLWSVRRPLERASVTRALLAVTALGGLGRVISAVQFGLPHPVFIAAGVVELVVVPLVLWWHVRAVRPVPTEPAATQPASRLASAASTSS